MAVGICVSCAQALADALGVGIILPAPSLVKCVTLETQISGHPYIGVNTQGQLISRYGATALADDIKRLYIGFIDYCTWPIYYGCTTGLGGATYGVGGFQAFLERLISLDLPDNTVHFDTRGYDCPYVNALVVTRDVIIPWSDREIYFITPTDKTTIIPEGVYPEFALTVRELGGTRQGFYAYIYHDANPTIGIPEAEAYRFIKEDVLGDKPPEGLVKAPGETLIVNATWKYSGPAKTHQVVAELGRIDSVSGAFMGEAGLRWQVDYHEPGSTAFLIRSATINCVIPVLAQDGLYDLEVRWVHLGTSGLVYRQSAAVSIWSG